MTIFSRWFNFILCMIMSTQLYAYSSFIDVYGTDIKTADKIITHVEAELEELRECIQKDICQDEQKESLRKKIFKKIHQVNDFSYVEISHITYHDLNMFTTIDVVEQKDHKRLASLSVHLPQKKNATFFKIDKNTNQLLQEWMAYEKKGLDLFLKGECPIVKKCPAYHCVYGFDHSDLKRYQAIFEKKVPLNKKKLIMILKNDSNEERRMATVFLLAHIKNGQELINVLTPYLTDSNVGVRNNVMRVLGMAIDIVRPANFDIRPIIRALDSPMETDRNKALCITSSLANQPKYAKYIRQHAKKPLMASLKMLQPNLHNNAYVVLRQISGQSYGERDYQSWENWFTQTKN